MKKQAAVLILSSFLILLFGYTAISKLAGFYDFKSIVHQILYSVFHKTNIPGADSIAAMVPLSELIVVLLLFFNRSRLIGLYASFWLMVGFTLLIGYMMVMVPKLPCSCGGVISSLGWKEHLVFNAGIVIITGVVLWGKSVVSFARQSFSEGG